MRIAVFVLALLIANAAHAEWMQNFLVSTCVKELPYFGIKFGQVSAPSHLWQDGKPVQKLRSSLLKQGIQILGEKSSYTCLLQSQKVKVTLDEVGRASMWIDEKMIVDSIFFDDVQYEISKIDVSLYDGNTFIEIAGYWKKSGKYRSRVFELKKVNLLNYSSLTTLFEGKE